MPQDESKLGDSVAKAGLQSPIEPIGAATTLVEIVKIAALPLVTLFLGFLFNNALNSRQARENQVRLYTEMMGRREEADSALRKDMFNSILGTFLIKDSKLNPDRHLDLEVLNLELLAYNFHESLDIGPLFKDVRRRVPDEQDGPNMELRKRLEKVAQEVIERQLTTVEDKGMVEKGETSLEGVDDLRAYLLFGPRTIPDPDTPPGAGVSSLCLWMDSTDQVKHYRQFKLEITKADPVAREVEVRLYVSKVMDQATCQQLHPGKEADNQEIDTRFWVGLFDFPMIDNTRLSHSERCAVSLTEMNPPYSLSVALAYFPSSRASLKDKPYYDEVLHDTVQDRRAAETEAH
jgi:hypothetical protein